MKVEFKRKLQLNNILYPIGLSDVPDEIASDWYFDAMVKEGDIVIIENKPFCDAVKKEVKDTHKKHKKLKD